MTDYNEQVSRIVDALVDVLSAIARVDIGGKGYAADIMCDAVDAAAMSATSKIMEVLWRAVRDQMDECAKQQEQMRDERRRALKLWEAIREVSSAVGIEWHDVEAKIHEMYPDRDKFDLSADELNKIVAWLDEIAYEKGEITSDDVI